MMQQREPSTESGIETTLQGLSMIADYGGYRERKEALQVLIDMSWFDNFGEEYYNLRVRVIKTLAEDLCEDDIPEEAAWYMDEVDE